MTDDIDQSLQISLGGAGQLVQHKQAIAFVELFEDADAPPIFADLGQRRAEHGVQRADDVIHAEGRRAGRADAYDAVGEVVDIVPGRSGSNRTLAVALFTGNSHRRQIVASQPAMKLGQDLGAAAESLQPV